VDSLDMSLIGSKKIIIMQTSAAHRCGRLLSQLSGGDFGIPRSDPSKTKKNKKTMTLFQGLQILVSLGYERVLVGVQ
jgi:hypothetical protein